MTRSRPSWLAFGILLGLVLLSPACKEQPAATKNAETPAPSASAEKATTPGGQWETYTQQADDLAAKNELVDAVAMYREALKLKSDFNKARVNLGSALMRLERYGEAAVEYTTALQADPGLAAAHINLASILLIDNKLDEALPHLVSALKDSPDVPDVHRHLGFIYKEKRDYRKAIDHFRRLTELSPKENKPWVDLGLTQLAAGQSAEGIQSLRAATERPEASVLAFQSLAWALATHRDAGIRNGAEAVKNAEQAVALADDTTLPSALRALAAAQAEKGDFQAGKATLNRAIKLVTNKDKAAEDKLYEDLFMLESSRPLRD
ncbi:MAG: tetratricopeptide repeat protein [Verrucomicrobiaceae bacterium]|nr:tetratricopeptide repeat protein [Verrucomicrobiaceae bacterium]